MLATLKRFRHADVLNYKNQNFFFLIKFFDFFQIPIFLK